MSGRIVIVLLVIGIALVSVSVLSSLPAYRLPGNDLGYRPVQPIEYSHRVHAGELGIQCLYCHPGAERSRSAGVPSADVCMNCHRYVTAPLGAIRAEEAAAADEGRPPRRIVSPELAILYGALGLDDNLVPDPSIEPTPIEWKRVHNLPDFVAFDHRPHVATGVACQRCHGPIESMDRVRQFSDLTMGWCVTCHRESGGTRIAGKPVDPPLDCATCHY